MGYWVWSSSKYNYFLFLQPLYGEQEDRIVKPRIFCVRHFLRENLRGNENTFLSLFLTHFLAVLLCLQQDSILFLYIYTYIYL